MLYANTHYESNHKIYIIANIFEEGTHDYLSDYNGAFSQFNITQAELHDKYDIHSGSIFSNLTKEAQEFFTNATKLYKQEELNAKADKFFQAYNRGRAKDYLGALLEHEAFCIHYLQRDYDSIALNTVAQNRGITVDQLINELIENINKHNNILVNYQELVEQISRHLETLDFEALYNTDIEKQISFIFTTDEELKPVKIKKAKK
jgi:hypothetical protein